MALEVVLSLALKSFDHARFPNYSHDVVYIKISYEAFQHDSLDVEIICSAGRSISLIYT